MIRYADIDIAGFSIGIISFGLVLLYAYYLLQKHQVNQRKILHLLLLSAIGHFCGAYALYIFSIKIGADSVFYFENATMTYHGFGYWFAFLMLGYTRAYLLGDSFLGAFMISGALGLLGSVYLFLSYKVLLDKMSRKYWIDGYPCYARDGKQLFLPAFLLLCWPSYLFWSAGIVKDNFAFLSICMIMYVAAHGRYLSLVSIFMLLIAGTLGFMVRPYLFVIFTVSIFLFVLIGSNIKFSYKLSILGIMGIFIFLLSPMLTSYSNMINFTGSISAIGEYAVRQQQYMAIGSSIPVPTHNPHLIFFFIPYLMFANLLLPLIFGARNAIGLISSIENAYLFWLIIWFIKNRAYWSDLTNKVPIVKFYLIYFLFGMMCLSLMCTNLGLAMREKMMYVPSLLLCVFLCYAYKRTILITDHIEQQTNKASLEAEKMLELGIID